MLFIALRPRALRDLAEIWAHIAADSPSHADILTDLFNRKFQALARHPELGRARPELAPSLRSFPLRAYVIFYVASPAQLDVVRVLHGSRDLTNILAPGEAP